MTYVNISTTDLTSRDNVIIDMLTEVQSMVSKFSRKYRMDYDDCMQHASLLMLEAWPKMPANCNVKAYLNATVRRGLHCMLKTHIEVTMDALSFDKPRYDDGSTLLDVLQASECKRTEDELQRLEKVTEVVHSALRQCRIEEQEFARTAYELTTYTPVAPANHPWTNFGRKKEDKPRRKDHMRVSIRHMFRRNPQVQALIQRETCVL